MQALSSLHNLVLSFLFLNRRRVIFAGLMELSRASSNMLHRCSRLARGILVA